MKWIFCKHLAVSQRDIPGIEPGPLCCHTNALTTELEEVRIRKSGSISIQDIILYFVKRICSLQDLNHIRQRIELDFSSTLNKKLN